MGQAKGHLPILQGLSPRPLQVWEALPSALGRRSQWEASLEDPAAPPRLLRGTAQAFKSLCPSDQEQEGPCVTEGEPFPGSKNSCSVTIF